MFEQTSFGEGVVPGGLRSQEEIKLLISYLLKKLDTPVSREKISDFLMEDSIANYFEINQALSEMIDDGVILCKLDDDGNEIVTLMGRAYFRIEEVENLLPRSIRQKALAAATKIISREKVEKNSNITVETVNDGFLVGFEISEDGDVLFRLSVFVTDSAQVELVKRNFCDRAANIYSSVISELMLDK